jgi:hypothetical protein
VHYRDSRFGLIPYLKYSSRLGELPIVKVVQGPRSEPELSKEALLGFLAKHRYERVRVCLSKVPLRF